MSKACKKVYVACFLKIGTPMWMKFWFKTILYIIKNYGRMEIVGILLARIYLLHLKNFRVVIHIKKS